MFDTHKPHPLLIQVPLTVSPFVSIPSVVTLPYTFRSVPTSIPPSIIGDSEKTRYVKSSSGHTAHPEDIINSCKTLQEHISKTNTEANERIANWENAIKERELAEKRRVAPGWLDRDEKILRPTVTSSKSQDLLGEQQSQISAPAMSPNREGEELDRAFGGLDMK